MKMNKRIELPLTEPLYKTYQNQGTATAITVNNPSIRNWYLNQVMDLTCRRRFLTGYTTPEITIADSSWTMNPYLDNMQISTQFTKGYINPIIREMLDNGLYVAFGKVDDYYIEGKSWYKERHFGHDGLICGYDQDEKTYCIYAYDSNWIYRKFWTPQKAFNAGRIAMAKQGIYTNICGLKPKAVVVEFSPEIACDKIKEYLDSDLEKYPFEGKGRIFGIVVHEYIAEYVSKLYEGDIPYERMDWRVFNLIWEHKKVMLERINMIEQSLNMDNEISKKYKSLVAEADIMRMLYAAHHMKRRDSVLPTIKKKLLALMKNEQELLTSLVTRMGKELENETVEIS